MKNIKSMDKQKSANNQINLRRLLGRQCEKGEKVLWTEEARSNNIHEFGRDFLILFFVVLVICWFIAKIYLPIAVVFFGIAMLGAYFNQSVKQKVVNIVTTERLIVISENGIIHRRYASIRKMKVSTSAKGQTILKFQEHSENENSNYTTIFHFQINENQHSPEGVISELLIEKGPYKTIEDAILKLMDEIGLTPKNNWTANTEYLGEIEGMKTVVTLNGILPVKSIIVKISCPNYSTNFLNVWPKESKMSAINDVKIGEIDFDKAFVVKSDARDFLETALPEEARRHMMNCLGQGTCTYDFGITTAVMKDKSVDKKSQFKDDDDVLDFQMLSKTVRKDKPTTIENQKTDSRSPLKFRGVPQDHLQMNIPYLKKYVESCLQSTIIIAKQIKKYNE